MNSAVKGSLRSNSARTIAWLIVLRITKVPAAPTLTTSKSDNSLASTLGRNVLCPPTLTPLMNTTQAMVVSSRRANLAARLLVGIAGAFQKVLHGAEHYFLHIAVLLVIRGQV